MSGAQHIWLEAFKDNSELGYPIDTVLELGVYYLPGTNLPGQSVKILQTINRLYPFSKMISVDIDPRCAETIKECENYLGFEFENHKFIASESLRFSPPTKDTFDAWEIDFIFLDTNHDDDYPARLGFPESTCGKGYTYRELDYFTRFLARNGRMFIHDTFEKYLPDEIGVNTKGAIELFIKKHPQFVFKEHNPNKHGLGEILHRDSEIHKYLVNKEAF